MTDTSSPAGGSPAEHHPIPPNPMVSPLPSSLTPRPGELTTGWRIATTFCWIGVMLAFAAVWNTSVELGLSTWWLGPRADPQPMFIRLSPFVGPVLILLATINHVRRLGWWGLAASGVVAAYGIGDLGRVTRLGLVELLVAAAAASISIASLTGTYRAGPGATPPTEPLTDATPPDSR